MSDGDSHADHSQTRGQDLKVLKHSPDLNNVKIGQGDLRLIIRHILVYHIWAWWPFSSSDLKQTYLYCIFFFLIPHMKFELKQPSDF